MIARLAAYGSGKNMVNGDPNETSRGGGAIDAATVVTSHPATIGHVHLEVRDLDRRGEPDGTSEWRGRFRRLEMERIFGEGLK